MSDVLALLGWRRTLISAFLVLVIGGALFATDTATNKSQVAQAGNCIVEDQRWKLRSGEVPLDVGNAHFGATVCVENGKITSVAPFLNGGVEGVGSTLGFQFINLGVWVERQTGSFVEVRARSQVKICLPGAGTIICGLTDTQNYTLRYWSMAGPYPSGTEPGIFTSSQTQHLAGGISEGITFVPVD